MTPMRIMAITQKNILVEKDPEVPVKEDIEEGTTAPGKNREEEEEDLGEGMTPMRRIAGGILVRKDENSAQGP